MTADPIGYDDPVPVKNAAEVFLPYGGIKAATLMNAIRSGKLKAERLGRRYFVTRREFDAYRKRCKVQPTQARPAFSQQPMPTNVDPQLALEAALAMADKLTGRKSRRKPSSQRS